MGAEELGGYVPPEFQETSLEATKENVSRLESEIRENTGLTPEGDKRPIKFFGRNNKEIDFSNALYPGVTKMNTLRRQESRIREGVDSVVDNLFTTLGNIGVDALRQYDKSGEAAEYLQVAATINNLALALRKTGEGSITFIRDVDKEAQVSKSGPSDGRHAADRVYAYYSGPVEIDGKKFENITFFIRPKKFVREIERTDRSNTIETRQARTTLEVRSADLPEGVASIRIDPPDKVHKTNRITFDVIVGADETNVLNRLDFGEAGQEAGHHFQSSYSPQRLHLGDNPWQVHEGIASRLEALTGPTQT